MKKLIIKIVIAIFIAAAVNFTWEYFRLLKVTQRLASELGRTKAFATHLKIQLDDQVVLNKRLEEDKVLLGRALASAQEEISMSKSAIDKLEQDLDGLKIHVAALEKNNALLRLRMDNLTIAKKRLEDHLEQLLVQKENLEARFYSTTELKKALKYLKDNPSEQRDYMERKKDMPASASTGNEGYIIKKGDTTYKPNINVKVLPAN